MRPSTSGEQIEFTRVDVSPFAGGRSFGEVGTYECVSARVLMRIDPSSPGHAHVADIEQAERGADGLLSVSSDLCIVRPTEPRRGNSRLLFEFANRGDKNALHWFNDAPQQNRIGPETDPGNGHLQEQGYAIAWLGWQGDITLGNDRLTLAVPGLDTSLGPVTETVRTQFEVIRPTVESLPLSGMAAARSYPAATLDTRQAALCRRRYPWTEPEPVPPDTWSFARTLRAAGSVVDDGHYAVVPSPTDITVAGGFEPGWIYDLTYLASDPLVLGLGHVVVRDVIDRLRHGPDGSELAGPIDRAYAWGRSQSGRCIRDFVYLGFNALNEGRRVFDGVLPEASGAGRMDLNRRFAMPGALPGTQYEMADGVADAFPYSYAMSTDHVTGVSDGILTRLDTDPLVVHTQTASEYWQRRGSLVHTDTRGRDLPQPEGVRIYTWASTQHFSEPFRSVPRQSELQRYPDNPTVTSMLTRAMLAVLDDWASRGVTPPPSLMPTNEQGTLVPAEEWHRMFPGIPGVTLPAGPNELDGHAVLVPAVDADGNDLGGVRVPSVAAPLSTSTGWNLRAAGHGPEALYMMLGSQFALPIDEADRARTEDPRVAIGARYRDRVDFIRQTQEAVDDLVAARLLLPDDSRRCVEIAVELWAYAWSSDDSGPGENDEEHRHG